MIEPTTTTAEGILAAFATCAVHAGERHGTRTAEPTPLPTVAPIFASNTFLPDSPEVMDAILGGEVHGYTYSRHHNPPGGALAEAVAELEGGARAVAYASGMAAVFAALTAAPLSEGDRVLLAADLYGASQSVVQEVLAPLGVEAILGDLVDLAEAERLIERYRPRAVLVETISNPLLRLVDGPALAALAHARGALLVVDNTFATPLLQRPLDWGADIVVHSATKYLCGHGDATAGVALTRDEAIAARLERQIKLTGGILGPFAAWLVHRGLKTLPLRFVRQCQSAAIVAARLQESGRFARVWHPLLADHPDRARAERLYPSGLCGAVVTLDLGADKAGVFRFLSALRLVLSATTVGDVYSLCLYPAIASHRNLGAEGRARVGITEGTVRLAVGIEDPGDIAQDVLAAVAAVGVSV
jgi:cystathionine beta-lyase/cystathionine gamma-synthase